MSLYGKPQYWEERYCRNSEPFDWYQRFNGFKEFALNNISKKNSPRVLITGCGNSRLAEEMIEQGYPHIVNIDSSMTCIKNMAEKYHERSEKIAFHCMDAKSLSFEDETFSAVIDKAVFDCIMCSEGSTVSINKMLSQVYRVLSKKGVYLLISYEPPAKRLTFLERGNFDWKVTVHSIKKPVANSSSYSILNQGDNNDNHYVYICQKQ